ncbi:MAG: S8 family serine peptidase [Nitrospira sp.]|nr:S8 family serine peptidase [Nitrospira sp.]
MVTPLTRCLLITSMLFGTIAIATVEGHAQGPHTSLAATLNRTPHVPNQVLVQFRPGVTEEAKDSIRDRIHAQNNEMVAAQDRRKDMKGDLELWSLPPGLGIARAVRDLQQQPAIEFVEPNWIYRHHTTSNDPYFTNGSLWGMYGDGTSPSNPFGSQAGEAWASTTDCTDVYIGIIDEGLMYFHEDLAGNVWNNPFDPVDGVDNDGNGFIDDTYGYDFQSNDNSVYDGSNDNHGTHVSGTVAAKGGNGIGVAGVCWNGVKLISAKFLGRAGGTTADAIRAVDYITDLKTRHGLNVVATNNSWGGGGYSAGLYDAIERANTANILFIAAAGNSGVDIDITPSYPASYSNSNMITVAAIDSTGNLASWSNYGSASADIGAPGVDIWSTVPKKNNRSAYGSYSGTSMATPHVTGAAALYAAAHPGSTAAQIKAAILSAAIGTPSLTGKTVTGGRLNMCSSTCP